MGYTLDAYGKPVFSKSPTQTVVDMQASADFAEVFAWTRGGTATERGLLTPGQIRDGMTFVETDTGEVFDRTLGSWVRRARVNGGKVTASTDASGYVTVNHGLRTVPLSVTANIATSSPVIATRLKAQVETLTATTFRVRILRADESDGPLAGNPVHFFWTAVA